MYTVVYNGRDCAGVGLKAKKRPNIPIPQKRIREIIVPGRSGTLHEDEGTYGEIEIAVEFNFISKPDDWSHSIRAIKNWMYSDGDGRLILGDNPRYYYKVAYVLVDGDAERKLKQTGHLKIIFVCDPFQRDIAGDELISLPKNLYNKGEESSPLFKIAGEGMCTLTVNGESITANVGQELMIDTELMIVCRGTVLENTAVSGDIGNLKLQKGINEISITEGFTAWVAPRWRYL